MSPDSGRRPYDVLRLGLLFLTIGALLLLALLLWSSLGNAPASLVQLGIVIALLILAAALGLFWSSRRLRRSQRPEWLETQAWRKDLIDKLQRGQPPPSGPGPDPRARPEPRDLSSSGGQSS